MAAAKFKVKALVVNTLLDKLHIADAVEFGLGDARMLRMIKYGRYTGLDVSPSVVRYNTDKFAEVCCDSAERAEGGVRDRSSWGDMLLYR